MHPRSSWKNSVSVVCLLFTLSRAHTHKHKINGKCIFGRCDHWTHKISQFYSFCHRLGNLWFSVSVRTVWITSSTNGGFRKIVWDESSVSVLLCFSQRFLTIFKNMWFNEYFFAMTLLIRDLSSSELNFWSTLDRNIIPFATRSSHSMASFDTISYYPFILIKCPIFTFDNNGKFEMSSFHKTIIESNTFSSYRLRMLHIILIIHLFSLNFYCSL